MGARDLQKRPSSLRQSIAKPPCPRLDLDLRRLSYPETLPISLVSNKTQPLPTPPFHTHSEDNQRLELQTIHHCTSPGDAVAAFAQVISSQRIPKAPRITSPTYNAHLPVILTERVVFGSVVRRTAKEGPPSYHLFIFISLAFLVYTSPCRAWASNNHNGPTYAA